MLSWGNNTGNLISGATPLLMQPTFPYIPDAGYIQNLPMGNTLPPQVIYKPNNQDITYKQNVYIRWLKPPTPPPLAPIIVREIQSPPEVLPPLIYRQVPPCPPTPPPIIVREQPPPCPPPGNPIIIEKRLPRTCLPQQVIVERCPPPPPKPQTIVYEKYLPPPPDQLRQVIVQRETCEPTVCCVPQKQIACQRIVRQCPQQCVPAQPALVCTKQQQQQITPGQSQVLQRAVPVFATRRHIVQPRGVRVIRQVISPGQSSTGIQQQQFSQIPSSYGSPFIQA